MDEEKTSIMARIIRVFSPGYGRIEAEPEKEAHGSNWNSGYGVKHDYSQLGAMSVFASHGYANAAASRISQDLAATPIRLIQGKGAKSKIIDEHPVLDLLNQPSLDKDGFEFSAQIIIDFLMTGNCYILLLGPTDTPLSIVRLHPEQVRVLTDENGLVYYEFTEDQLTVKYPKEKVLHIADASWQTGPSSLYGTGKVQPLTLELKSSNNANQLLCQASSTGIPGIVISPSDPADIWGPERRKQLLADYQKMAKSGGAMCISSQVQIEPLQISSREMEFSSARKNNMEVISAAFGIPPSVLGLPSATYATAKIENLSYWEVQKNRSKRFSSAWTRLAQLWDPTLRIEYDFGGVPALQDLRGAKIDRIIKLVQLGMPVADAFEYEGMGDAPIVPRETEEEETEEENRALLELIVSNYSPRPRPKDEEEEEGSEEEKPEKKTEKSSGLNGLRLSNCPPKD